MGERTQAKALARMYIEEVWNSGNLTSLEDLTTEDFAYHLARQPARDRDGMRAFLARTREAFPDWRVVIKGIVADEDAVAVRWTGQVTHLGSFHGVPPTGRTIEVSGINFYRLQDGKVAEEWEETDSLGMLAQLGVLPG